MLTRGRSIVLVFNLTVLLGSSGCFSIRSVLNTLSSTISSTTNTSYTVITSKSDGCTNNTLRKEGWTTGLELLCQTSQTVGIKSVVAYSNVLLPDSSGNKNLCWIATGDLANTGRKVFCVKGNDIIRLNTDTLDIPEQPMRVLGTNLYFFGRKPSSQFKLYRWDQSKITELSGNYTGSGTW